MAVTQQLESAGFALWSATVPGQNALQHCLKMYVYWTFV